MFVVQESSLPAAWLAGAQHIQKQEDWREFNLILSISSPTKLSDRDKVIQNAVDGLLRRHDRSLHTVAETIFPGAIYAAQGSKGVYETYPEEIYPAIKKANPWGTYAHRLVRLKKSDEVINPLKIVVERLDRQLNERGKKRACYEISLTDSFTDIPLFDNEKDIKRSGQVPCLSHVSFKLDPEKRKVHLTALYRSHYYVERALGNLIGLARLQDFVAREIKATPGELVCVSTYAKLDEGGGEAPWRKKEVTDLLDGLRNL